MKVDLGQDAWFILQKNWLPAIPGLLEELRTTTSWEERDVVINGLRIAQPRLVCWMAPEGVTYRYSGSNNPPSAWTPAARRVLDLVREHQIDANACFLNLYRDGNDSIGWHADDERIFGPMPLIASVSLGTPRRFLIRRRHGGESRSILLDHGDLLVMGGTMQKFWIHSVPKSPGLVGERINLTFRRVLTGGAS